MDVSASRSRHGLGATRQMSTIDIVAKKPRDNWFLFRDEGLCVFVTNFISDDRTTKKRCRSTDNGGGGGRQ